jgi:hypothetical protein
MSFRPYRLVTQLAAAPELAVLAALDAALKQAACALLAAHQDIGIDQNESPVTSAAHTVVDAAWDLRILLRRYRATLARSRRDIPF